MSWGVLSTAGVGRRSTVSTRRVEQLLRGRRPACSTRGSPVCCARWSPGDVSKGAAAVAARTSHRLGNRTKRCRPSMKSSRPPAPSCRRQDATGAPPSSRRRRRRSELMTRSGVERHHGRHRADVPREIGRVDLLRPRRTPPGAGDRRGTVPLSSSTLLSNRLRTAVHEDLVRQVTRAKVSS